MDIGKILENLVNNTRTLKRVSYVVLALTVAIDFFISRHHHVFFWEDIPGFSAFYGFISCVLIVVISKALGHYWLERSEEYYND